MHCLSINVHTDLYMHTVNTILCRMHCDIAGTRTFVYRYTENTCTVYIVACCEHYVVGYPRGFIIVCTLNYNIYI